MSPTVFPIEVVVEPLPGGDREALICTLDALAKGNPTFLFADEPDGKIVLKGETEAQLAGAISRVKATLGIAFSIGPFRVAYRETLRRKTEISYTHCKILDGADQFAKVTIIFEPAAAGAGSSFESKIVDGAVPTQYIPAVERGVESVMGAGVFDGFPVIDVKTTLIDGAYHDADSSDLAFEIAARAAFREALEKGGSVVLEPVMKVEVLTPEAHAGFVIADLVSRGGYDLAQGRQAERVVVRALAPLARLFGYPAALATRTKGDATLSMSFSHYAPQPPPDGGASPPAAALRA
jgi:elongation factor G